MSWQTIDLSRDAARRFLVHAFALDRFQGLPDVVTAVDRLGSVQEDSINVCGRIHDLIFWARVREYAPEKLAEALYAAPRQAFETYFPNLHVLPIADYRYFVRAMHARRSPPDRWRGLLPDEIPVAEKIFQRIDREGALRTRDGGAEEGHTTSGWGARQTVISRVTEKLWLQGYLTVAKRQNFERWFDRTERCLPAEAAMLHAEGAALPDYAEEAAYLLRKRLRGRRLFRLRKAEVDILGEDAFVRVDVEGDPRPWFATAEDLDLLRAAESLPSAADVHLLAPLDPLIYDRERNRLLFDFDYTWEVYTPQAKRRWGYYVLPILAGDRLIGRVDPKVDRTTGVLTLHSLTLEPGVDPAAAVEPVTERLRAFARFLGASRMAVGAGGVPKGFRRPLAKRLD